MKPDALPDMIMGDDKAPVTVIEYASMTCPHCAHFQETTFPELKKRYIDTGKVRYIFREFPLDSLAAAAFMLARCAGENDKSKYFAMVDTLFRQQRQWAVEKPIPPLLAIAKQAGFTEKTFDACLANQKVLDGIESMRQRAAKQVQGAVDADLLHQRHAGPGRPLDRGNGQGDRPLSQGLIRVFWRRATAPRPLQRQFCPAGSPKGLENHRLRPQLCCSSERGDSFSRPMRHTATTVRAKPPERIAILFNAKPSGTSGVHPGRGSRVGRSSDGSCVEGIEA